MSGWTKQTLTTANTTKTGTGDVGVIYQAKRPTRVHRIIFRPLGANVATVARVFLNNGEDNDNPTNNSFFDDITLEATTLDETAAQAAEQLSYDDLILEENERLLVTLGTTVAAGWQVTALTEDYEASQVNLATT